MDKQSEITVDELFEKVLEVPKEERQSFLSKSCIDKKVQEKVLNLLANHDNLGDFLEGTDAKRRDVLYKNLSEDWPETTESRIGSTVEKYTLSKEIGRGGRSTVYLGHRQEEDWQQDVAIKILRRGIDTDDVLRRFHAERQILSHLQHPGIANILDAGITDDGLPWFAMELVDGENIRDYCELNKLNQFVILAIDLTDGKRTVFAKNNNYPNDPDLLTSNTRGLVIDKKHDVLLIGGRSTILAISLETGERVTLSK